MCIHITFARGVLIGLCGVFLGVGASLLLFACVGVECCIGVAVWFRTCALAPATACGLAAHTDVGPGFDSTSPAKSRFRFASHRTGNLSGKTENSDDAVGAFGKTGRVDTICISLIEGCWSDFEKAVSFGPCALLYVSQWEPLIK